MSFSAFRFCIAPLVGLLTIPAINSSLHAAVLWTEGEKPVKSHVTHHPWWYEKVHRDQLSGGDFLANWGPTPGEAEYAITAPQAGSYEFWVRANPSGTKLSYQLNGGEFTEIDLNKEQRDQVNLAADNKADVRFMAWAHAGSVKLREGANTIVFRMHSANNNHGMLDCFVLANEPFEPNGILKPGDTAAASNEQGWFVFNPKNDPYDPGAGFDLRSLNEKEAGDDGFIAAKNGQFIHSRTGKTVRFWGVNGPPDDSDPAEIRKCARMLAKHGVNVIRGAGSDYDKYGKIDPALLQRRIDVVEAMKSEGIYTVFTIYWFNQITPKGTEPGMEGYDGKTPPIAALFFNPELQKTYQSWWTALLTTPSKRTGKRLIDEPALAAVEIQNEDSLFFWTFNDKQIPDPQMRIMEKMFGDWLVKKYGSLEAATKNWQNVSNPRDNAAEGRMGFRNYWNVFHERKQRDKDAMVFLAELQRGFDQKMIDFLRATGFKGVICTSGWTTADPQYLGPIDKYTNTVADYVDRHGYFSCARSGQNAGWAVMNAQTYADRSALRFDPPEPGKGKIFADPVMDPHYDDKPSFISEISIERPNRYRSEAPLYDACYGALQNSGGFAHNALDTARWSAKPGYYMQPWGLMSPDTMGQFPAAALIYRQGLVATGDRLVDLNLKISDIENLQGTPMPQGAALDEFRMKDVPAGTELKSNSVIDPLVHYAGRTDVHFSQTGGPAKLVDLSPFINHAAQTVVSTTGELKLDYGKGILTINAPAAQGVSGNLQAAGLTQTRDLEISSDLDLGHIIAVSLDGQPLATSSRILLQVMSEDEPTGFRAEPAGNGRKRIREIGRDPWLVKKLSGTVKLKRADAGSLKVTALDANGMPTKELGPGGQIKLQEDVIYYLISR